MPNLLETIQQNRANLAGAPAQNTDQTQRLQDLLRAKSGRATGGGETATSNLGEQQAVQGTNAQLGQLAGQAQIQTQAENQTAANEAQQTAQQKQAIDQGRRFDTVQNRIQTQSILNDLGRNKGQVSLDKQRANLEQVAFNLSMQDKDYVDSLQDVGRRRRLDDEANFRNEMAENAFGSSLDLLKQKLGQGDVLQASDRDFQKTLSKMSIDDAKAIADLQMDDAAAASAMQEDLARSNAATAAKAGNQQAMYQGIGGLASAGIQGYGSYQDSTAKEKYYTSGAGKDSNSFEAAKYRGETE